MYQHVIEGADFRAAELVVVCGHPQVRHLGAVAKLLQALLAFEQAGVRGAVVKEAHEIVETQPLPVPRASREEVGQDFRLGLVARLVEGEAELLPPERATFVDVRDAEGVLEAGSLWLVALQELSLKLPDLLLLLNPVGSLRLSAETRRPAGPPAGRTRGTPLWVGVLAPRRVRAQFVERVVGRRKPERRYLVPP